MNSKIKFGRDFIESNFNKKRIDDIIYIHEFYKENSGYFFTLNEYCYFINDHGRFDEWSEFWDRCVIEMRSQIHELFK